VKRARITAIVSAIGIAIAASSAAAPREVLPWVEDFSKAAAQARAKNVPLFVEAWAPW
jgi:hypothetical protein